MQKGVIISLIATLIIIVGALFFAFSKSSIEASNTQNVRMEDGKQIITISAKGGYAPRRTIAEAGISTVLEVKTNGTYDCSSALVIPKRNFRKILAPVGSEEIIIPAEEAVGTLQGLCSMGMYSFLIEFK